MATAPTAESGRTGSAVTSACSRKAARTLVVRIEVTGPTLAIESPFVIIICAVRPLDLPALLDLADAAGLRHPAFRQLCAFTLFKGALTALEN